jgi:hypothetical protein
MNESQKKKIVLRDTTIKEQEESKAILVNFLRKNNFRYKETEYEIIVPKVNFWFKEMNEPREHTK